MEQEFDRLVLIFETAERHWIAKIIPDNDIKNILSHYEIQSTNIRIEEIKNYLMMVRMNQNTQPQHQSQSLNILRQKLQDLNDLISKFSFRLKENVIFHFSRSSE